MAYTNYEKGTWTPTLTGAATAGTTTYSVQQGYYNVVGNLVFLNFFLSGTGATGTGAAQIGNFPFANASASNIIAVNSIFMANNASWTWTASTTAVSLRVVSGMTFGAIRCMGTGTSGGFLNMANAAFQFQGSLLYFKAT